VTVLCPRTPGVESEVVGGVRVHRLWRLGHVGLRYLRSVTYFLNLFRYVVLHGRRHDVVHVHLANLQADVVVAAARLVRVPTHLKVANSGTHGETRRLERIARVTRWYGLRHADSVQALSEETRGELVRIGVDPARIVGIPNGVPAVEASAADRHMVRRELGLPDGGIVLFLGRFARYKGLADLLDAWRKVGRGGWTLLLVGEEALDEPFGVVPDLDGLLVHPWTTTPRTYLAASDVFVLPSHSEGMSNALLEAMAAGVAIVSSDTGAASEMLQHRVSGLVHPTGDVAALADELDAVMSDDSLRRSLADGALARSRDFSVERVVDQLEDVYDRIGRSSR
jgi:glycosyltransferase involved in cell wall biosynthesis